MKFLAIEHIVPTRAVTNDEVIENVRRGSGQYLSHKELDRLEQFTRAVFDSTGTTVRYQRAQGESAYELCREVGQRALRQAKVDPEEIDLLIYTGVGRGFLEPATANVFSDLLGLKRATSFDVLDACASWMRSLDIAHAYLASQRYKNIMILNGEFTGAHCYRYELRSLSEFAYWHPGVTIGEAGTATIITASEYDHGYVADFRTWGKKRDLCFVPLDNFRDYLARDIPRRVRVEPLNFISFGAELLSFGSAKLIEHYKQRPEYHVNSDIVFGHAASDGMSRYVLDNCDIDRSKFRFTHNIFGNTVSASVPLAMSMASKDGGLVDGSEVLVLLASAGVTTGIAKFRYFC